MKALSFVSAFIYSVTVTYVAKIKIKEQSQ
jgi:hypothetical protein